MLDQNIATVATFLTTDGGTLGGEILGVILPNRYTMRHKKAKGNNTIIEEI